MLPDVTLIGVWVALTVAVCAVAAVGLRRAGASCIGTAFVLLLVSAPGRSNLDFGQVSILVFGLTMVDACCVSPRARGWLTGIATGVKLTPVVFLAMFAVRRQWAELARAATALAAMTVLAALVDPAATRNYLAHGLLSVSTVSNWAGPGNQSIRAMMARLGITGPWWLLISAVVVAAALVWTARRRRSNLQIADWCVMGAVITLVSPISWTHHRWWLIVPLLLPTVWPSSNALRRLLLLAALAGPVAWWPLRETGVMTAAATGWLLMGSRPRATPTSSDSDSGRPASNAPGGPAVPASPRRTATPTF